MDIDPAALSDAEFDEVARRFQKGLSWCLDDNWEMILSEAIEQVMEDRNIN